MNVNYNLLKVLNALLSEVHVTKAGERVFLSQAATSNALNQLREIFEDQLLQRKGAGKMQLTPFAKSLIPYVSEALQAVEHVFNRNDEFVPENSQREYIILISSYIEPNIIYLIDEQFKQEAPNARLQIKQVDCENLCNIKNSDADIIINRNKLGHDRFGSMALLEDRMVFCVSSNHPINNIKQLSLSDILNYSIVHNAANQEWLNGLLKNQELHSHIAAWSEASSLDFILDYDYIGCLPLRQVMYLKKRFNLNIIDDILDFSLGHAYRKFTVYMNWKRSLDNNSENLWLRRLVSTIV